MGKGKLVLLVIVAMVALSFFFVTDWQVPITPVEISAEEVRGFKDGRFDAITGRAYQRGFYNPPVQSVDYWTGYCEGFETVK